MRKDIVAVSLLFVLCMIGYVAIWVTNGPCNACRLNLHSNHLLTVRALSGAALGFARVRGARSGMLRCPGRVVTLLSAGLVFWSWGSIAWTYYNFRALEDIPIPYPSWADAGYAPQYVLALAAVVTCFRMTNKPFNKDLLSSQSVAAAAGLLLFNLFTTVRAADKFKADAVLKFVLDVGYPLAASSIVMLLVVFLSGPALWTFTEPMKSALETSLASLLGGTFFLGLGDLFFNIGTSPSAQGTFWEYTNGNWMDALYLIGLLGVSISALSFPVESRGTPDIERAIT